VSKARDAHANKQQARIAIAFLDIVQSTDVS